MSWRGFGHREIFEMVVNGGQGIGISDAAETAWDAANTAINDAEREIGAALSASRAEWEGMGAEAMRTAYSPLGQWAVQAATSAARTAGGVGDQAVIAMETQRLVADNPPPQNVGQHLHSFFGGLDGDGVYLDQAATVDRLMVGYEESSVANEERFDIWSVPPTVVVTPAAAAPSGPGGPGGGGVGGMPQTGGLGPADGSGIAAALAPGGGAGAAGAGAAGAGAAGAGAAGAGGAGLPGGAGSPAAGGATPAGAAPAGGAGVLPGAVGSPAGGSGGTTGAGGAGTGRAPGAAGGVGPGMPGSGPGAPGAGTGAAGAGRPGTGGPGAATGGRGLGTGGVAHPSQRPLGSAGGSGTGPGPWSRAGTDAGRSPAGATPLRPVVPTAPPRTSTPDWRSVLLPPEREASASTRTPGETAARSAGPGAPGGSTATQAAAQGSGARGAGSPGMHAPMMGGGGAGAQPEGRRRASYLIDDSDAFVDKRWFTEPVMTPDDPL